MRIRSGVLGLLGLVLAVATAGAAIPPPVAIDGRSPGRVFEGIGAVSAGASTRLLADYPEPQRSDVLDFLFAPSFGAGFQHLKVEIGGGENSTCGSEPSHAITRDELAHPKARGYEFWLMGEARNRNPQVMLDCLPWCYPGWISGPLLAGRDRLVRGLPAKWPASSTGWSSTGSPPPRTRTAPTATGSSTQRPPDARRPRLLRGQDPGPRLTTASTGRSSTNSKRIPH